MIVMTAYLAANACLALTWLFFATTGGAHSTPGRAPLQAARAALTAAVLVAALIVLSGAWPPETGFVPAAGRWREMNHRVDGVALVARAAVAHTWQSVQTWNFWRGLRPVGRALVRIPSMTGAWLVLGLFFVAAFRLFTGWIALLAAVAGLPVTFRLGSVRVLASHGGVPYSAWLPWRAYIVVPTALWQSAADARVAIRHELEHHRNGDTRWIVAAGVLESVCFWNPAARAWARLLSDHQEFACDEALLGRGAVSPQAYGRCLLRVAEMAVASRPRPAGTTGLAARAHGSLLKRRIEMMIVKRRAVSRTKKAAWLLALAAITLSVVGAARAAQAFEAIGQLTADRSLSLDEARKLVSADAAAAGGIPIEMNELVLRELNRDIGTPEARLKMKEALARLEHYRTQIEQQAASHHVPADIVAVPLVESRYKNVVWSPGAGLWGFIKSTAREYGLVVEDGNSIDERLDVAKETVAAMELFSDLYDEFGDWRLALRGYNEGQHHLRNLIERFGTRDAWTLERKSESREHYLAGVTAALILLENPTLLE